MRLSELEMQQRFRSQLAEYGLSARSEQLEQLALPAIRISSKLRANDNFPIGASKLGGLPDFPPGIQWPLYKDRPLALMAQLNMAEVAFYDLAKELPVSGILYFFYDMVDQPWGYDPANRDGWHVLYCDVDRSSLVPAILPRPAPNWHPLPVCEVAFYSELTLPPDGSPQVERLDLNGEEKERYFSLIIGDTIHRLLGYPAELQGDICWEAQLASHGVYLGSGPIDTRNPQISGLLPGVSDWRLLFQMDDDNDGAAAWFGGAGGRLYYSIRQEDLRARNFDHIWASFQWQ